MSDEMMHAQMAAAYAAQRQTMKHHQPAEFNSLPPYLREQLEHFMTARQYTAQQALSIILSKFFGSCSKSPQ